MVLSSLYLLTRSGGRPLQWWAWAMLMWRPSAPLCALRSPATSASWPTSYSPRAVWCLVSFPPSRPAVSYQKGWRRLGGASTVAPCGTWLPPSTPAIVPTKPAPTPAKLPLCLPPASCHRRPAGHKEALEEVARQATAKGALKAAHVAVSGAFHTPLMQPARDALTEVRARGMGLQRRDGMAAGRFGREGGLRAGTRETVLHSPQQQ